MPNKTISKLKIGKDTYDINDSRVENLGTAASKNFSTSVVGNDTTLPTGKAVQTYVTGEISKIPNYEVVVLKPSEQLPQASKDTMLKIYLVPISKTKVAGQTSSYIEYLTVQNGDIYTWEVIGSTEVDLSKYLQNVDIRLNSNNYSAYKTLNDEEQLYFTFGELVNKKSGSVAAPKVSTVKTPTNGLATTVTRSQDVALGSQTFVTGSKNDGTWPKYSLSGGVSLSKEGKTPVPSEAYKPVYTTDESGVGVLEFQLASTVDVLPLNATVSSTLAVSEAQSGKWPTYNTTTPTIQTQPEFTVTVNQGQAMDIERATENVNVSFAIDPKCGPAK